MKRHTAVLVTGVIVTAIGMQPLYSHAGAFDGALGGAILGNMVGGRKAARKGAIVGGVIGATNSIANDQRQRKQQEEARQRRAEWEAQQTAEQARIEQQMAAAAPPAAATNQTLIVETQKSLIRMGYDPGTLGQAGPELTSAVFKYQRNKGLLETGELSQALLTHLLRNGG
jgi:uncharacterized protein YcfJ